MDRASDWHYGSSGLDSFLELSNLFNIFFTCCQATITYMIHPRVQSTPFHLSYSWQYYRDKLRTLNIGQSWLAGSANPQMRHISSSQADPALEGWPLWSISSSVSSTEHVLFVLKNGKRSNALHYRWFLLSMLAGWEPVCHLWEKVLHIIPVFVCVTLHMRWLSLIQHR